MSKIDELERRYKDVPMGDERQGLNTLTQLNAELNGKKEMQREQKVVAEIRITATKIMTLIYGQTVQNDSALSTDPGSYLEMSKEVREHDMINYLFKLLSSLANKRARTPLFPLIMRACDALYTTAKRTTMAATSIEVRDCMWIGVDSSASVWCVCGDEVTRKNGQPCRTATIVCMPRERGRDTGTRKTNLEKPYEVKQIYSLCTRPECSALVQCIGHLTAAPHLLVMFCTLFLKTAMDAATKGGSGIIPSAAQIVNDMFRDETYKEFEEGVLIAEKMIYATCLIG